MKSLEGRVWTFGDNIDTDAIVPGQYLDAPIDEAVKHVLESVNPNFAREVEEGLEMLITWSPEGPSAT